MSSQPPEPPRPADDDAAPTPTPAATGPDAAPSLDPAPSSPTTVSPSAHDEPTVPVKARWIAGVALVSVGANTAIFATLNQLMPLQATQIAGEAGKEAALSLAGTVGVIVAMLVNPIVGALSDRTTSRWGRRTPWIVAGAILATAFLLLTAGATSLAVLCLGWAGAQAGLNSMTAAITATVPDRAPVNQRGLVGGVVATGITLGILIGSAIGMVIAGVVWLGYLLAIAVMLLCLIPYLRKPDDPVLSKEELAPFSWREFLGGFWVSPRRYPDFAWAWLGRLLMMTATQLTIVYLLFYLSDVLRHEHPASGVFVLTAVYAFGTLVCAAIAGKLSDRTGRRPLVAGASVLIAIAAILLACAPLFGDRNYAVAIIAAAILGLGNGAYLGVDFALLTQVLPHASARGKDMGIINIAASLPQIFALGLAWLAVTHLGGYTALFVGAGVIGLLGAASVYRIKSVR